jgi:predicted amidophosphoribosyltransferase
MRERGFNQSMLIAERFSCILKLPLEKDTLVRIAHRKPQSITETVAARRENIRGCFAVCNVIVGEIKNIILIDDVSTSGSTFLEAARALTAAGTEVVIALAVARA